MRTASCKRTTKETDISVTLSLDGGAVEVQTGIGFLTTCSQRSPCMAALGCSFPARAILR